MQTPSPRSAIALGAILLCAAAVTACNRTQAEGANAAGAPYLPATQPVTQPVAGGPAAMPTDACPSIGTLAESRGGRIALNGARMIRLTSVCTATQMTEHLRTFGAGSRFILVADDLRAGVQPGALFELRLGPPSTGEAAVIGTLNFYAAQRPGSGGQPHSISYDVTNQVQTMAVAGWPAQGLGVAVAPSAAVMPGADASIGAIRLVAQAPR